jgi:pyridoxine 4-dehydrogenase
MVSAASAGTWRIGDLTVNRVGLGAMRLTANADGTASDRDRAISVLRRAIELGVNHIDTAAAVIRALRSCRSSRSQPPDARPASATLAHRLRSVRR